MKYRLTKKGKEVVADFLAVCEERRKDILDAGKDTADDTELPDEEAILQDVELWIDEDGDYYNNWGVTDNYDSPYVLGLSLGSDFEEVEEGE